MIREDEKYCFEYGINNLEFSYRQRNIEELFTYIEQSKISWEKKTLNYRCQIIFSTRDWKKNSS